MGGRKSGGICALALWLVFGAVSASAQDAAEPTGAGEPAPALDPAMDGVESIEVTATAVDEVSSREQADEQINTMSGEAMSDFSVPDVAAGLRFVPGVNVVDGQFAVIRGLEDRYNSTLFNSAPVPSPDPDSQSVQLDLFPSDVVSNLVIAKTFAPDLPSNSSGGSVNILTNDEAYDEDFQLKLNLGTGWNEGAAKRFIDLQDGSPIGKERDGSDTIESEYGAALRGNAQLAGRELHYKGVVNWEVDFDSKLGYQESREPARFARHLGRSGGLSTGKLDLSGGRFDLTQSERAEQGTAYFGFGLGLDEDGNHSVDASTFYTRKVEEAVLLKENGYLPGFDYSKLGEEVQRSSFEGSAAPYAWITHVRPDATGDPATKGPAWFTNFAESKSFERERDLIVSQLNGDHWIGAVEGLHVGWVANYARTTQDEDSRGLNFFFEPDDLGQRPDSFPVTVRSLGSGRFGANNDIFLSTNGIEETQTFARLDADYETDVSPILTLKLTGGGYYEKAKRDVAAAFLETPSAPGVSSSQYVIFGDTALDLGNSLYSSLLQDGSRLAGVRETTNDSVRDIQALSLGVKATLWEQLDVLGGYRFERISIRSHNDPFTGEISPIDQTPAIFPNKWVFFDRLDTPPNETNAPPAAGRTFNDQLLGIRVPVDPATGLVNLDQETIERLVNGEISERRILPSLAFTYRPASGPLLGLTLRGAFSQTVARPSFREMGYYVSVEPGTDDLIVGNPQLGLSDVESWDLRAEYGGGGLDLVALSAFRKQIEHPIESIVVRDPINVDGSSKALYRTFFNNPDTAALAGIELEAHKNLAFLGPEIASYFSLGANYTFIDAKVDRVDAELDRARPYFGTAPGGVQRFSRYKSSRRLFGQPEWIANLNLTFDQPDWGTKATVAFFAISDILDAAGSTAIGPDGSTVSFTPDRYVDSYSQLDLTVSQTWNNFTFKLSVKNLTDSTRRIVYDPTQTSGRIPERSFKVGRDLSFSVSYRF
jgi:hypothetical protein